MLFLFSAATIKLPYYLFPRRKLKYSNETNTFLLGIVISIEVTVLNLRLLTSYKFKVDQEQEMFEFLMWWEESCFWQTPSFSSAFAGHCLVASTHSCTPSNDWTFELLTAFNYDSFKIPIKLNTICFQFIARFLWRRSVSPFYWLSLLLCISRQTMLSWDISTSHWVNIGSSSSSSNWECALVGSALKLKEANWVLTRLRQWGQSQAGRQAPLQWQIQHHMQLSLA